MKKEEIVAFEYGAAKNGATIFLIPELNTILLEAKGDVLLDEFIEVLLRALQEIEERKITNWIADTSQVGSTTDEHSQWLQEVWMPRVIQAGLKKLLTVLPNNIIGEMTVQEMTENIKETASKAQVDLQFFYTTSLDEAIEWLKNN